MVCKYCGKPLPNTKEDKCPHCFAAWSPKKEEQDKAKTEAKTVNGHD